MADWEIALEKQLDTWVWLQSDRGITYNAAYLESVKQKYPRELPQWEHMQRQVIRSLWVADPVYVTREMFELILFAQGTFEPEPLREEELLLKSGFAYFPQPAHIVDVRGKRLSIRAISWAQAQFGTTVLPDGSLTYHDDPKRGVIVTLFSMNGDSDDYYDTLTPQELENARKFFGGALVPAHQLPLVYGENIREDMSATRVLAQGNDPLGDPELVNKGLDQAEVLRSAMECAQLCQVLWRLMGQRIGVGFKSRPNRATRKRAAKAGMEEKYITVVTLRRPKVESSGETRHVDWTHRWVVSGHWRWQPYKDGTVRQIWIAPYVKGPDDKPLVLRGARVFRLAR